MANPGSVRQMKARAPLGAYADLLPHQNFKRSDQAWNNLSLWTRACNGDETEVFA